MSVQPSLTRSSSAKPPVCSVVKFISHFSLPARLERREPVGVDRVVVADVDRRRRALEHEQLAGVAGEVRDALHRGRAGADDADALVGELRHRRALGVAAGVVVVPPARVEGVAGERLDARGCRAASAGAAARCPWRRTWRVISSPRSVRMIQRWPSSSHSTVGDLGREERVVVEVEVLGDALACSKISGAMRVLLRSACARSPRAAAGRSSPPCRTCAPG